MTNYTLSFQQVDKTKHSLVGGKGANLGELSSIPRVEVPDGFCITTDAYAEFVESSQEFKLMLKKLSALKANESKRVGEIGAAIRKMIEHLSIPVKLDDEISRRLASLGKDIPYAIRSSATAEDLPHASFAGQQDTYLNVIGKDEI